MSEWDEYGESTSEGRSFFSLEPGESTVIEYVSVKPKTFPAGSFSYQDEDLTVPSVTLRDEEGRDLEWDLLNTTARNRFLELKPESGTMLFVANHGTPKGKRYIAWTVRKATDKDSVRVAPVKPKAAPAETPAPAKVETEPDF